MREKIMSRKKGFTLVETIAAMVIMGIVLAAALTMFSLGSRAASNNKQEVIAYCLLQMKMEEVTALPFAYNINETDVVFSGYTNYLYSVNHALSFDGLNYLKKVTVTVRWPMSMPTHQKSLTTTVAC
jgi:prepilin-type N-terminal cleavage/methylation domain-containing protein